jgi:DNA-binding NarL/FixJ family response regulator
VIDTMIVDDEPDLRLLLRLAIDMRNEGLRVTGEAASGREAIAQVDAVDPTLVVLDQMMPDMDGLETAAGILERRPHQLIVLYSAFLDEDLEERALAAGITACRSKGKARDLANFLHDLASGQP